MNAALSIRFTALVGWLTSLSPRQKTVLAMFADVTVLGVSASLAIVLSGYPTSYFGNGLPLVGPLIFIAALYISGAYKAVIRFIGMEFVYRTAIAVAVATLVLLLAYQHPLVDNEFGGAPWNLILLFSTNGFFLLVMMRMMVRQMLRPERGNKHAVKALIYGAGGAGTQVASALAMNSQCRPVGFVDDRHELQGRTLQGLRVYAPEQLTELKARGVFETVLVAMPSVARTRQRKILESLESLAVKVLVMPAMEELANGRKQVDELRQVQIEDLLERDPVAPIPSLLNLFIKDKVVMVTGAGGSIGSELCRQAIKLGARKLVLVEVSEFSLYKIDQELRSFPEADGCAIVAVLSSVLDRGTLSHSLKQHKVETVYHAAAYKHVPLVEANIVAAVRNNVLGTSAVVRAAVECEVKNFVLISTDKAVRPTNVMGASKRVCELIVQAAASRATDMRMSMVRFGNVLASSGSVVPLFREQIAKGGPVTVTHPDVTRYFMTIPEAAQLVIQAGAMGRHGEVFVLDMGQPVKISDLAERMIHLSGLELRKDGVGDVEVRYTGLRPGEKLYEELLIGGDTSPSEHPRICRAREAYLSQTEVEIWMEQLERALSDGAAPEVVDMLKQVVTGFMHTPIHDRPISKAADNLLSTGAFEATAPRRAAAAIHTS